MARKQRKESINLVTSTQEAHGNSETAAEIHRKTLLKENHQKYQLQFSTIHINQQPCAERCTKCVRGKLIPITHHHPHHETWWWEHQRGWFCSTEIKIFGKTDGANHKTVLLEKMVDAAKDLRRLSAGQ
ncbi:hypothetical protein ILYODFUR_024255 [Ilyodon furcidens]|uniref:Uncharacterized protein n=1 Tax=Ilyodon furcidens TaxID=33524 RepID=A0ABV0TXA1_9TELE